MTPAVRITKKSLDIQSKVCYNKYVRWGNTPNKKLKGFDTMTNSDKMTNRKALDYVLSNCDIPADVREKFEAMIVALDKKSGTERKPSAHQLENERIKAEILETMEPNVLYDIQTMLKTFDCFDENFTSQRVSALLSQLVDANLVNRVVDKRKTYFSLA